jgi:hypothetical protein
MLLGVVISAVLYGVCLLQAFMYFMSTNPFSPRILTYVCLNCCHRVQAGSIISENTSEDQALFNLSPSQPDFSPASRLQSQSFLMPSILCSSRIQVSKCTFSLTLNIMFKTILVYHYLVTNFQFSVFIVGVSGLSIANLQN